MSFLGNNPSRPNQRNQPEPAERANGESTTFLGEANLLTRMPEQNAPPPPPSQFAPENRENRAAAAAQAANTGPTPPERCANVIAAGARWQGTLTVEDSVRIDGNFSGEVQTKGTVHVADGAQVDAKVRAGFVVVSGNFCGEIRCDQRVELLPRSRVNGEVITKVLTIQEGAILDGRVQMTGGTDVVVESSPRGARAARGSAEDDSSLAERRQERITAGQNRPTE